MKVDYNDDELKQLRAVIEQARREGWNSQETSIIIQHLIFTWHMKYNEPESKGVISDE